MPAPGRGGQMQHRLLRAERLTWRSAVSDYGTRAVPQSGEAGKKKEGEEGARGEEYRTHSKAPIICSRCGSSTSAAIASRCLARWRASSAELRYKTLSQNLIVIGAGVGGNTRGLVLV